MKLSELPPEMQKQLLPAIAASKAKLTPAQRSANSKAGWLRKRERLEREAKQRAALPGKA